MHSFRNDFISALGLGAGFGATQQATGFGAHENAFSAQGNADAFGAGQQQIDRGMNQQTAGGLGIGQQGGMMGPQQPFGNLQMDQQAGVR